MPFDSRIVTAPFRMQPGLRRLAAGARQLTLLQPDAPACRAKLAVLARHAHQALLQADGFDAGPALDALVRQAADEHPHGVVRQPDGGVEACALGWRVRAGEVSGDGPAVIGEALRHLPPRWRLAGLLSLALAEDFAVIDADGRIPWTAVCLPSHWAPEDKVGRSFAEVHAPVADNTLLLAAADHLARLVTGEDRWERFVWTITTHPGLDQHPRRTTRQPWPDAADAAALADLAWLRTERQTFVPLVHARQAVFTIRVELVPLAQAIGAPEDARRLHAALSTMSDAVLAYRGLTPARARLLDWLARQAQMPGLSARP